jgi:hypothetical protein
VRIGLITTRGFAEVAWAKAGASCRSTSPGPPRRHRTRHRLPRGQIARGFALMSRTLEALAHVQEEIDEPIIQAPVDSTGAGEMYTPASSTLPVYNLGGGQRRPAREVK